jgi:hypothetical protein
LFFEGILIKEIMKKEKDMKFTNWFHYFWKVPLCGLIFFLGCIPGGQLAAWLGLSIPEMPVGADQTTVANYTLLGSLILALGLAALARGLSGGFLSRWLILFFFTWIAYGVNNYFEAAIFTTMSAGSLYTVVLYLPALLLCSAAIAWLFPPETNGPTFFANMGAFFAGRTPGRWIWRLLASFLAFPFIYSLIGTLIAPIVVPYYRQDPGQLILPGWGQILPVLALRSLLFLLVCLPILIAWNRSNGRLFLTLGLTLFLFVGGLSMIYAYWLAPVLRVTHSLEILVDEMIYAGALILLLRISKTQPEVKQVPVPAT